MSSRAIRRLRQENELFLLQKDDHESSSSSSSVCSSQNHNDNMSNHDDSEEESQEEEEEESIMRKKQSTFTNFYIDDSSSSASSCSSSDGSDDDKKDDDNVEEEEEEEEASYDDNKMKKKETQTNQLNYKLQHKAQNQEKNDNEEEEADDDDDFDAILSEFNNQDHHNIQQQQQNQQKLTLNNNGSIVEEMMNVHTILINNQVDIKDFDLEHSLRSMLGGGANTGVVGNNDNNNVHNLVRIGGVDGSGRSRRNNVTLQKRCLFAQGREGWGRRPTSYIGGGLGMEILVKEPAQTKSVNYDNDDGENEKKEEYHDESESNSDKNVLPWPYNDNAILQTNHHQSMVQSAKWYSFRRSNTYQTKLNEFQTYIASTGDINLLTMFIADNPFIVEPMLQLAMFFFHSRENEKGMDFIKRILWILECASIPGFLPSAIASRHHNGKKTNCALMNYDLEENEIFFSVLNLFIRNSTMVGCVNTSLAASRLLLSLDPLRDPMGILTVMDYFALATLRECDYRFVVEMVESKLVSFI